MTQSPQELEAQAALNRKLNEIFDEKIATRILDIELPKRRPGTHWTGPSGEHIEVPVTARTLANLQRWGRTIT